MGRRTAHGAPPVEAVEPIPHIGERAQFTEIGIAARGARPAEFGDATEGLSQQRLELQ